MGHAALSALHLASRFFGALDPRGPGAHLERWALDHLLPGEVALWVRMSGPDRRHAVGVASEVVRLLGPRAQRPVVAAALLHDVGKVDAGLGTLARVPATVLGLLGGRRRWHGRLGTYLRHDSVGAGLLRAAGADELTATWAEEHHLPPERWSLPLDLALALKRADGD